MPLFTKLNEQSSKTSNELIGELINNSYYQNTALELLKTRPELTKRTFYVFQKEFATISPASNFDWLGSGDATTCVIVLLRADNSKRVSVGHFDGADNQITGQVGCSLSAMINSFTEEERNQGLCAHLVGGYCDEKDQGKLLTNKILEVFSNSAVNIHLDTFFTDRLNTEQKPKIGPVPRTQGAAIHTQTGQVILVSNFKFRGPEIPLRSIHSFLGSHQLQNIYDPHTNHMTLGPYYYQPWTKEAKLLLNNSDKELLQNMSTSPKVEGPNFVKEMRRALGWLVKNPNCDMYFKGKPRVYAYKDGKDDVNWEQVPSK